VLFLFLIAAAAPPVTGCERLGEMAVMGAWPELLKQTAVLSKKDKPCLRYLRGEALLQDKSKDRSEEALAWLEPLTSEKGVLGEWAQYRRMEALLRAHKRVKTVPSLGRDFPWSVQAESLAWAVTLPAREAVAKIHQLATKDAKARQFQLELALQLDPADDVARRGLFTEFPDAKSAPLAYPPASVKDLRARAAVLSDKHMNADVLKTTDAALAMSTAPEDRCALLFYKGAALRKLRRYKPAEDILVGVRSACAGNEFYKRAWYLLGQVQVIAEPALVATKTLIDFGTAFAGDALVDDALFLLAVTAEKAGDKARAMALYEQVAAVEPAGDMCAEATFRAAYIRYVAEKYADALPLFDRIAAGARCSDDYERARGLYWQSRTRDRLHAPDVEAPLRTLVAEQPLSYYGLLARARLHDETPLEVPAAASQPVSETLPGLYHRSEAMRSLALAALGLYLEAQAELSALTPPPGELLGEAALLATAFDFYHSHLLVRTQLKGELGQRPAADNLNAWLLAYPRPFADAIAESERREGLPADFLLALIREESAFMLDVGSWANAFGLTQLLVETANDTARDMKLTPAPTAEQLKTDARLSIALGAHHLAMLGRKVASPALVLAAYNAGMGAVKKWQGQRAAKPADEFIEEIPLDETRGYVKRIYRSWAVYRVLAGAPLPPLEASQPLR
jgi:soluble lytic murein transglycosylase